jgi:hypothetical protein
LTSTSSVPAAKNPSMAAFTSEVNIRRQRCHCSVPGSTSVGQVTLVAPTISAEMSTLMEEACRAGRARVERATVRQACMTR